MNVPRLTKFSERKEEQLCVVSEKQGIVGYSTKKVCTDCKLGSVRPRIEWVTRFAPGLPKNFIVSTSLREEATRDTCRIVEEDRARTWPGINAARKLAGSRAPLCRP